LRAGKSHFYRVMARFGITNRDLGVTPHGLRHQYANDRYELFSGVSSAVRQGPPVDPAVDTAARLEVAAELGHARKEITGAYLGQSAVMRSKARKAPPAGEPDGSCSA
jgi:integrase